MNPDGRTRSLLDTALRLSGAEQTEVTVRATDSSLTRFANNQVHQNVAERDLTVSVRAQSGRRYGLASTNDLSDGGLQRVSDRALELARALPDRDDFLGLPEAEPAPDLPGYNVSTAEFGPMQRAVAVRTICHKAQERDLVAAGAFRVDVTGYTVANSLGLLAHHASTTAELMTVVMSDDSSGHAAQLSIDAEEIDAEAVADEAIEKALKGRSPRSLGPGEYEVVLEEHAVSDMLDFLGFTGFGALSVQEGRSFMSGKQGSAVMGPNVSIWDDPLDPSGIPRPFDAEGIPARRVDLVVEGVARSPVYDRRTAVSGGTTSTGHALPPEVTLGPLPRNMFLEPGGASKQDLIRSVDRGLLVTRFWYTRVVHPLSVQMTGMTRDGTFLIENGEIVAPVRNLRFTESYLHALGRVGLIGSDTRLVRDFFSTNRVPALKIDGWSFTGSSQQ